MENKKTSFRSITLLRTSVNTFLGHSTILYPLLLIAFIQLLTLELLYFYPRFPLNVFFGPIVRRLWSEGYLHYPFNFALLPQLFYYAQLLIYIFIGAFLSAVAIEIIAAVNNEKRTSFKTAVRKTLPAYVHIFILSILSLSAVFGLSQAYGLLIQRALKLRAETGILSIIKKTILYGAPYADLLLGVIVTTALAFTIPIIVIERKKIFAALILNFRMLLRSLFFVFTIVLLPTLLYVPILLLRSNFMATVSQNMPIFQFIVLMLSVLVTIFIDATVLTATTTFYLHKKEDK